MTQRKGRWRLGLQRLVEWHPIQEVERVGPEEPSDLPIERFWEATRKLYQTGLHPAIGLHIRHRGRVVLNRTVGHTTNPPGGPSGAVVTPDTLFNLFSASKIVTGTLVMALAEDGVFGLHDRVVDHLPEFGQHGKTQVQIQHLLNHTAGIPNMPKITDLEQLLGQGGIDIGRICAMRPDSAPGQVTAYHALTAGFVLQEIVERRTGKDLRSLLRSRLMAPLGFKHLSYGVASDLLPEVAQHAVTGLPMPRAVAHLLSRNLGLDLHSAIDASNRAEFMTAILPSANVIGSAQEMARFMDLLMAGGELDGVRVLKEETVREMVTDVTPTRIDRTYQLPMRYGLGVMMGGNRFSLFGLGTPEAFGHIGLSAVVVYADPARELSVAFMNSGKPMFAPGMIRWYAVLQAIASGVPVSRATR